MLQPSKFITNSDFATLKNDNGGSTSITFLGSTSISGSSFSQLTSDLTIGARASINRLQISSSKDASTRYATLSLGYTRTGTSSAAPASYGIVAYVSRTSATNLRFAVYVPNPYGASLTTESGNETFTFYINTFIPPFAP